MYENLWNFDTSENYNPIELFGQIKDVSCLYNISIG